MSPPLQPYGNLLLRKLVEKKGATAFAAESLVDLAADQFYYTVK